MADVVKPDDVLTCEESALVSEARREMREGKYVSLAQLERDLARSDVSSAPEKT
jgi:CBS domain-containing protein